MTIERNNVVVKLDQEETETLESAFFRMAVFENQLLNGVAEDELPVGVKDQMLNYASRIKRDIILFLGCMGEDTTELEDYDY